MGFYLPELKWRAPKGASFTVIADSLERVIDGNRFLAQKHKWPHDRRAIEDWVDTYNATVCLRMGWDKYVMTDDSPSVPKSSPLHQAALLKSLGAAVATAKELVRGAKSLAEWNESKDPAVSPEIALRRAKTCADCPKNDNQDLTAWFTVPAAELIKRQVEKAQSRKLTTPQDDNLHLCTACHCPLRLKVHVPIEWISKRLSEEQKARMKEGKNCWVLYELGRF